MAPRSPYRFYFAGQLPRGAGREVALPPGESHHLIDVLRLRPGALVDVFDASGRCVCAEVARLERPLAWVRLLADAPDEAMPERPEVNVAVAFVKRRAMDWMIEKLSELGVTLLQPLATARSVRPGREAEPTTPDRWERLAIAAAKQCGRNQPLLVAPPQPLLDWLARPRPPAHTAFAHRAPDAIPIARWLADRADVEAPRWIAIGPEGGWTPEECDALAAAGFRPITLGPLTLRVETAAIAAAALCRLYDAP